MTNKEDHNDNNDNNDNNNNNLIVHNYFNIYIIIMMIHNQPCSYNKTIVHILHLCLHIAYGIEEIIFINDDIDDDDIMTI